MEPPLLTLVFVVFGFLVSFYALCVESESRDGSNKPLPPHIAPSRPPPPPPPPSPPPPSPPPPSPPPPPFVSPPPPPSYPPPRPLPPPSLAHSSTNSDTKSNKSRQTHHRRSPPRPTPPPPPHAHENKINAGKKIGLLFSGMAAILQVGVISFLVFKRRQILKVNDRYETCS